MNRLTTITLVVLLLAPLAAFNANQLRRVVGPTHTAKRAAALISGSSRPR